MPSATAEDRTPVRVGDLLDDKYRIVGVLGAGGMGVVLRAEHVTLQQTVAVKVPVLDAVSDAEVVERSLREARAAGRLRSEHVCRVLDAGRSVDGIPYIVLEYLEGNLLSDLLRRQGRLSIDEAMRYVLEACEGVAEAHAAGIIHRDLKPANLFLARTKGRTKLKVLDFGISKTIGPHEELSLTSSSVLLGSPKYIAPEQMRATRDVDARADVWALGVCLYELLTGRVPFPSTTIMDLAVRIANDDVPPPTCFRPELPAALEAVILRCLSKAPGDRFADARELSDALLRVASPSVARRFVPADSEGTVPVAAPWFVQDTPPPSAIETVAERTADEPDGEGTVDTPPAFDVLPRTEVGAAVVATPRAMAARAPVPARRMRMLLLAGAALGLLLLAGAFSVIPRVGHHDPEPLAPPAAAASGLVTADSPAAIDPPPPPPVTSAPQTIASSLPAPVRPSPPSRGAARAPRGAAKPSEERLPSIR